MPGFFMGRRSHLQLARFTYDTASFKSTSFKGTEVNGERRMARA